MTTANDVTAILIEYVGEQTKPTPPLAFVLFPAHLGDLNAVRTPMAVEMLPPRMLICSQDELAALASAAASAKTGGGGHGKHAVPVFTVTVGRRDRSHIQIHVDSLGAPAMLAAMHTALRSVEARQALQMFRALM
jgi:hypothetical protein